MASLVGASDRLLDQLARATPETRVLLLSLEPSPRRCSTWPEVRRASAELARLAATRPRVRHLDLASPLLAEGGQLRPGCQGWAQALRPASASPPAEPSEPRT